MATQHSGDDRSTEQSIATSRCGLQVKQSATTAHCGSIDCSQFAVSIDGHGDSIAFGNRRGESIAPDIARGESIATANDRGKPITTTIALAESFAFTTSDTHYWRRAQRDRNTVDIQCRHAG